MIKIIDCPRDAMQGWKDFIPTETKIEFINTLLQVGFDTLDFGSFVSPKAIPQLADTKQVLSKLNFTSTKLLAIVANSRGAEEAVAYDEIGYIGFPFSISETFQLRNTNSTIQQSLITVEQIQQLCFQRNKKLVIYISMGFGNPYGDLYSPEIVANWVEQMNKMGVEIVALSDTIGVSNQQNISYLFKHLIPLYPNMEIGAHLHTTAETWKEKIDAAFQNGCKRFDGALKGFGGCPMAMDKLTGNMPTENMIQYFQSKEIELNINYQKLEEAMLMANQIFVAH
jgi:hydroxymethylglutaryl-CoA lyase